MLKSQDLLPWKIVANMAISTFASDTIAPLCTGVTICSYDFS